MLPAETLNLGASVLDRTSWGQGNPAVATFLLLMLRFSGADGECLDRVAPCEEKVVMCFGLKCLWLVTRRGKEECERTRICIIDDTANVGKCQ